MKRVLFVDDEPRVLDGLRRMLYPFQKEWEMVFARSGAEALERLAESHFDVLITDVRMPQMSGIQLLSQVLNQYPQVVRIVLSGEADREITLASATLAHQYLAKPCSAQTVRETVDRALNLRFMCDNPTLAQLISRMHTLPSLPSVYTELITAVQSPDTSAADLGQIVGRDVAMTAKVLQLVNSSLFSVQRRITTPAEAVIYLGFETIQALALTVSVFSQFDGTRLPHFSLERLRDHSMAVGALARTIARSLNLSKAQGEDVFLAGLLHEIGRLILACNCSEAYETVVQHSAGKSIPIQQAEFDVFGTTHAEIGAYLLWLWGLPDGVIDVVAYYDRPRLAGKQISIAPVHVANALIEESEQSLDQEWLDEIGVRGHLAEWKRAYQETADGIKAC